MTSETYRSVSIIARHVCATLPDSLSQRRTVLLSMLQIATDANHVTLINELNRVIHHLDQHELAQREFTF